MSKENFLGMTDEEMKAAGLDNPAPEQNDNPDPNLENPDPDNPDPDNPDPDNPDNPDPDNPDPDDDEQPVYKKTDLKTRFEIENDDDVDLDKIAGDYKTKKERLAALEARNAQFEEQDQIIAQMESPYANDTVKKFDHIVRTTKMEDPAIVTQLIAHASGKKVDAVTLLAIDYAIQNKSALTELSFDELKEQMREDYNLDADFVEADMPRKMKLDLGAAKDRLDEKMKLDSNVNNPFEKRKTEHLNAQQARDKFVTEITPTITSSVQAVKEIEVDVDGTKVKVAVSPEIQKQVTSELIKYFGGVGKLTEADQKVIKSYVEKQAIALNPLEFAKAVKKAVGGVAQQNTDKKIHNPSAVNRKEKPINGEKSEQSTYEKKQLEWAEKNPV